MFGCPVCGSPNVRIDLDGDVRGAACHDCDATWEQRGSRQRGVHPGKLRGMPDKSKHRLAVFPMKN